jgi:hypothetical protein
MPEPGSFNASGRKAEADYRFVSASNEYVGFKAAKAHDELSPPDDSHE